MEKGQSDPRENVMLNEKGDVTLIHPMRYKCKFLQRKFYKAYSINM